MSSHLTITYQTGLVASGLAASGLAASGSAASGSAAAKSPAIGARAGGDAEPLGFLAALIDSLAGAATGNVATRFGLDTRVNARTVDPAIDPSDVPPSTPGEAAPDLLARLDVALSELDKALADGRPVDPDLLKKLSDAAEALAALLGPPQTLPAPPAIDPELPVASVAAQGVAPQDASILPSAIATLSPSALAALSKKLERLSAALSAQPSDLAPDLAAKLAALSQRIESGEFEKTLLARLRIDAPAAPDVDVKLFKPVSPLLSANIDLKLHGVALTPRPGKTTDPASAPAQPASGDKAVPDTKRTAGVTLAAEALPANGGKSTDAAAKTNSALAGFVAADASAADGTTTVAVNPGGTPPLQSNNVPRGLPTPYQVPANQANLPQIAFQMVQQFQNGQSRFQIRLDPPELGRVDVKMHVDASGNINARLTVERSETLDMFQRDQRSLEKALAQAGLDSSKTNLEFSLKQSPFGQGQGGAPEQKQLFSNFDRARVANGVEDAANIPLVNLYRGMASAGGVNLFV